MLLLKIKAMGGMWWVYLGIAVILIAIYSKFFRKK